MNPRKILLLLSCSALLACSPASESSPADNSPGSTAPSTAAEKQAVNFTVEALQKSLRNILAEDLNSLNENERRFEYERADLNGDGRKETFVRFVNGYFCGSGGCSYLLLDADLQLRQRFTQIDPDGGLVVMSARQHGWRDLVVMHRGPDYPISHRLMFDGQHYPENASMAPEHMASMEEDEDPGNLYLFSLAGHEIPNATL